MNDVNDIGGGLREPDIEELLSFSYVLAVAVRGGFRVTPIFPDRASTDMNIEAIGKVVDDGQSGASFQVQAKARSAIDGDPLADDFPVRLSRSSYDHLRDTNRARNLLLIVLELPALRDDWLHVTAEQLTARRCAYWCHLKGRDPVDTDTVTVRVSRRNVFDVSAITQIMTRVARRQEIGYEFV